MQGKHPQGRKGDGIDDYSCSTSTSTSVLSIAAAAAATADDDDDAKKAQNVGGNRENDKTTKQDQKARRRDMIGVVVAWLFIVASRTLERSKTKKQKEKNPLVRIMMPQRYYPRPKQKCFVR